jgi:hypothetical protein
LQETWVKVVIVVITTIGIIQKGIEIKVCKDVHASRRILEFNHIKLGIVSAHEQSGDGKDTYWLIVIHRKAHIRLRR